MQRASTRPHSVPWVLVVGVVVAGLSQLGVWWVHGFQVACARGDLPQCGLAMGRTGAATVATALTLLTLVALVAAHLLSPPGRRAKVHALLALHVVVSLVAVAFTLFSTGFVVPT